MLCRQFNKILHIQSLYLYHSQIRSFGLTKSKCQWRNFVFAALKSDPMSSYKLRLILRDFTVTRLWNACFRTQLMSTVVKRCRRERVRDMWVCFRQTLLRPSRTLLLSVAAYTDDDCEEEDGPPPCSQDISDEDLEALVHDFEAVDELSRTTLFCEGCQRRIVIDKKHPGVVYCSCSGTNPPGPSADGWAPYMEADDVIIWRKEYKPGGLFAYKVYGRYKDLTASDFAMIQVDGAYRRSWDDAVAALSIVEREANGVRSQAVLHWEVMWPRLFANRDYVYLRRHKQFEVTGKCLAHKEAIFSGKEAEACEQREERPSVHSRAKLKAMELDKKERVEKGGILEDKVNKVYVIVSRSCTHPEVPETRNAIRVQEYWSHMVVRTINGADSAGMEFVLTYYDEPSVGGMPSGVSAWATGRAAPGYLARMRRAALHYPAWRALRVEAPDFEPFESPPAAPRPVEHRPARAHPHLHVGRDERDMESSKCGPELDSCYEPRDKGTQTDVQAKDRPSRDVGVDPISKYSAKEIADSKNKIEDIVKTSYEAVANDEVTVAESVKVEDKVKSSDHVEVTEVKASGDGKVTRDFKVEDKAKANDEVKVTEKVKAIDKVEATDEVKVTENVKASDKVKAEETNDKLSSKESREVESDRTKEQQTDEPEGDETRKSSWWRYLYPFYYFV